MSEHNQSSRSNGESTEASEQRTRTEFVERSDVGVSLTVKLKQETKIQDSILKHKVNIYD